MCVHVYWIQCFVHTRQMERYTDRRRENVLCYVCMWVVGACLCLCMSTNMNTQCAGQSENVNVMEIYTQWILMAHTKLFSSFFFFLCTLRYMYVTVGCFHSSQSNPYQRKKLLASDRCILIFFLFSSCHSLCALRIDTATAFAVADMNVLPFICVTRMTVIMFAQIQTQIDTRKHEK